LALKRSGVSPGDDAYDGITLDSLLEEPTPIIFLGVLVEAVLGVVLLRTGRGIWLWAMAAVVLAVLAGLYLESAVVTERERVEAVLEAAVAAVADNDQQEVLRHIHPTAADARTLVDQGFGALRFTDARITHLEIQINNTASPPMAIAEVTGTIWYEPLRSDVFGNTYTLPCNVELRRYPEPDGWMITGASWGDLPYP